MKRISPVASRPLTVTRGTIHPSRMRAATHRQLEVAHRNSLRLLKLVNSLLDFSRIEAGRIHAVYEPVDLARLTTEIASVFRSAFERAGVEYVVRCPHLAEPVYVDRDMSEMPILRQTICIRLAGTSEESPQCSSEALGYRMREFLSAFSRVRIYKDDADPQADRL